MFPDANQQDEQRQSGQRNSGEGRDSGASARSTSMRRSASTSKGAGIACNVVLPNAPLKELSMDNDVEANKRGSLSSGDSIFSGTKSQTSLGSAAAQTIAKLLCMPVEHFGDNMPVNMELLNALVTVFLADTRDDDDFEREVLPDLVSRQMELGARLARSTKGSDGKVDVLAVVVLHTPTALLPEPLPVDNCAKRFVKEDLFSPASALSPTSMMSPTSSEALGNDRGAPLAADKATTSVISNFTFSQCSFRQANPPENLGQKYANFVSKVQDMSSLKHLAQAHYCVDFTDQDALLMCIMHIAKRAIELKASRADGGRESIKSPITTEEETKKKSCCEVM
eukprot:gnl/TRDRNA2_/TRDRNA2_150566_c0_seq1.p1 gnl/TRDRNA2_/TRDRNA2_150566_c0~~gnl/TRDRNA2_/TRDRNA2_150566_c0_seq1.p1  ORF type:complete len:374 (+),score=55.86 gnl/TRDRNA2_/TRDRNA2_150566_c0_seq1:107-1123(+)